MSIGEEVLFSITRDPLPLACFLILYITERGFVDIDFTDVVQKAADGGSLSINIWGKFVIDVQTMFQKTTLFRQMKTGGSRSDKEIRPLQPSHQVIQPRAVHIRV